jgi:hypothetical protein
MRRNCPVIAKYLWCEDIDLKCVCYYLEVLKVETEGNVYLKVRCYSLRAMFIFCVYNFVGSLHENSHLCNIAK